MEASLASVLQAMDRRFYAAAENNVCLWPSRYVPDESDIVRAGHPHPGLEPALRFVTECCWTYNEADGSTELIPDMAYIRWFAHEWLCNRSDGGVLICEKSRRLIMSWVCRALELWSLGLRREKIVICGLNYTKSAEHVWRIAWLYRELAKRRPELGLRGCDTRGGNFGAQEIEQVILPNGSLVENLNQMGQSFQGSGYSGVVMEEFSQYAHPSYMYSQARRVTEGKPGSPGGYVVAITNAWPSLEWKEIKRR